MASLSRNHVKPVVATENSDDPRTRRGEAMTARTKWLAIRGAAYKRHRWFRYGCLCEHYDIPTQATEVRFVRGKNSEALHHEPDPLFGDIHFVSEHHDTYLDDSLEMCSSFQRWFGTKPGWVSVEWR